MNLLSGVGSNLIFWVELKRGNVGLFLKIGESDAAS